MRFPLLLQWAREQGADFIATGHYARLRREEGVWQLLRGRDRTKDQSYMLHALRQEQLARTLFPLGDLLKEEVRALARQRGLPAADQPESQDVCFLVDGDYRRFVAARAPQAARPGPIVDRTGRLLGQHTGLVDYTIGQRKGIGVAAASPLYVLALDPQRNALWVGPAEELGRAECVVNQMHYLSGVEPVEPFAATAQIRYRQRDVPVCATPLAAERLHVRFRSPQRGLTPGQYLVLYDGEVVVGGGAICASWEIVLQ